MESCIRLVLLVLVLPLVAQAAGVTIYWRGVVSDVFPLGESVPSGVLPGAAVSGTLVFDPESFESDMRILGSYSFGNSYKYTSGLVQTINVGDLSWIVADGRLTLLSYSPAGMSFDAQGGSDNHWAGEAISFPDIVESYYYLAIGFSGGGDLLFDAFTERPNIDIRGIYSGSGGVTTSGLDLNGDVTGYYFDFDIQNVSMDRITEFNLSGATIPEPLATSFLAGLISLIYIARRPGLIKCPASIRKEREAACPK